MQEWITGAARKSSAFKEQKEQREKLFLEKYSETVHISLDSVIRKKRGADEIEEYEIKYTGASWYKEVINVMEAGTEV